MAGLSTYFLHSDFISHEHSGSDLKACGVPAVYRRYTHQHISTQEKSVCWQEGVNDLASPKLFCERNGNRSGNQKDYLFSRVDPVCNTECMDRTFTAEEYGIYPKTFSDSCRIRWCASQDNMALRTKDDLVQNDKYPSNIKDSSCSESLTDSARWSVETVTSKRRMLQHQTEQISNRNELEEVWSKGNHKRKRPVECTLDGECLAVSPHQPADSEEDSTHEYADADESEYALRRQFPFFLRY
jgi:hypothetical protein